MPKTDVSEDRAVTKADMTNSRTGGPICVSFFIGHNQAFRKAPNADDGNKVRPGEFSSTIPH